MKNKLLTYTLLFFSALLFAQISPKEIQGLVISDSLDVTGIHILNINSKVSTITNQSGSFQIPVRLNDTLLFSAIQYKLKRVVITTDFYTQENIIIKLTEKINKLSDVIVRPYNLSGSLAEDVRNINTDDVINGATLGLPNATVSKPTQSERKLYAASTGGVFTLDPIINAITGRTKMLKNRVELEKEEKELYSTMTSFEKSFYVNHFKIPEEYIIGFLYFCAADPEFEKVQGNSLLVLDFFELKSKDYLKSISSEK